MQKFLTIFTPTYNRAFILPKLYESLKNQTDQNFVWLVVDDGSTDETKVLVREFQKENKIEIRYVFQENKGKHFAVNSGLRQTETEFFCVIDSDDFLAENAVGEMKILSEKISGKDDTAGFTFIRFSQNTNFDPLKYGSKEWLSEKKIIYDWEFPGEMIFCLKTKIYQQFYFPEFSGEKFCPESLVLRRIERKFKILVTDKVLAFGEYLEDGLMKNFYQLLLKSPKSSLLNIRERLKGDLFEDEKKQLAKSYWDIVFKTKQPKINAFISFPVFLSLPVLLKKLNKKLFN